MTTQERIMEFFKSKNITDIQTDTDLFKGGYVNSLFALEIVMFLEKEFKIKIKNRDITEKNFRTIDSMAAVIEKYL